jgi:hypothetical protein
VHILADGVSSQFETDRKRGLERMRQAGAFITTSESALFWLAGDAKAEGFKVSDSAIVDDFIHNDFQQISKLDVEHKDLMRIWGMIKIYSFALLFVGRRK